MSTTSTALPRFGRITDAVARSGLSKSTLYDLAKVNPGLFKKLNTATLVDFAKLDEILAALPDAELDGAA